MAFPRKVVIPSNAVLIGPGEGSGLGLGDGETLADGWAVGLADREGPDEGDAARPPLSPAPRAAHHTAAATSPTSSRATAPNGTPPRAAWRPRRRTPRPPLAYTGPFEPG